MKHCLVFPVREINIDSLQAPEPRSREEFLQCKSQKNDAKSILNQNVEYKSLGWNKIFP